MSFPSYTIAPDGKSITCHKCGRTSHHPQDVKEKFCGSCHVFHGEPDRLVLPARIEHSKSQNQQMPKSPELDSANHFLVGTTGMGVVALTMRFIEGRHRLAHISKAEAINLAVWLKVLADPGGEEFARVEKEVRSS